LDLGYLLPEEMVKTALWSIFRYNWRKSLRGFKHSQRVFAEGDESGLIVCTWPNGGRPQRPILYCDEVWTGHEYEVAALLLWNGMADEALKIVEGARNRYRGDKRNPFAEIECGHYYIRALSSWSLLLAATGFSCDVHSGTMKFAPKFETQNFKAPFFAGTCWGVFNWAETTKRLSTMWQILGGKFNLKELQLQVGNLSKRQIAITLDGKSLRSQASAKGDWLILRFPSPILLTAGAKLQIELR